MTILFYPIADSCRNGCLYCFEDKKEKIFNGYDKSKMAKKLEELVSTGKYSTIILHGGEILDLPLEDFEFFIAEMRKHNESGPVNVQTSLGVPLSPEHFRLLKTYGVNPGISVDGPPEFNCLRGPRNPEENKKFQDIVYSNIQKLKENNLNFGSITILSKANASPDKIDHLIKWCVQNATGGRFNPLFVPWFSDNAEIAKQALTPKELTNAYMKLLDAAIKNPRFDFRLLEEIKGALVGDNKTVCTFRRCDYITTQCTTILPDGGIARCDRCFQDGYYYASPKSSSARSFMLEQTECKGCRFFPACGGGCPSEGQDGDFRSKTGYCESYFAVFAAVENILRKMFPGIFLTIDVHDYYNEYALTGRRFNYLIRHDECFADTLNRMNGNIKLRGWTPDSEKQNQNVKNGYTHMDTNSSAQPQKKSCSCGDKKC